MPVQSIFVPVLLHGLAIVMLGVLAVSAPRAASLTVDAMIGIWFLISAGIGLAAYISVREFPGTLWLLAWAMLAALIGVMTLAKPDVALLSMTVLLMIYLFTHGFISILAALEFRDLFPQTWGWGTAEGVAHIALACVIWIGLPQSSLWTVGTLVGGSLILFGANLIMIAMAARAVVEV